MKLLVETVEGFEEQCLNELKEISSVNLEKKMEGYLLVDGEKKDVYRINYGSGTVNKVLHVVSDFKLDKLDDAYEKTAFNVGNFLDQNQEFVVRVEKGSSCGFGSTDLAVKTGQKIVDTFKEESGETLSVDLHEPDIVFKLVVQDKRAILGLDTTGKPLNSREYLEKEVDTPPILANCLVRRSGWNCDKKLLDPFARDGVVAVEAARIISKTPNIGRKFGFIDCKFYSNKVFSQVAQGFNDEMSIETVPVFAGEKEIGQIERHAERAKVKVIAREETALERKYKDKESNIVFDAPYLPQKSKRDIIRDYLQDFEQKVANEKGIEVTCTTRDPTFFQTLNKKEEVSFGSYSGTVFEK